MKEFARAILSDNEDKLDCEKCNQQMDAYIDAQFDPDHSAIAIKDYKLMQIHIDQCPSCADEYEKLLAISDLATSVVDRSSNRPEFDLTFVKATSQPLPAPNILHEFGHMIIEFTNQLLQPRQPMSYATVGVKSTDLALGFGSTDADYRISIEVDGRRLETIIRREDKPNNPEHCTIIVEIDTPDDDWVDWEGRAVTLSCREVKVGDRETDAFGQAIFEDIETQYLEMLKVDIDLEDPLRG